MPPNRQGRGGRRNGGPGLLRWIIAVLLWCVVFRLFQSPKSFRGYNGPWLF